MAGLPRFARPHWPSGRDCGHCRFLGHAGMFDLWLCLRDGPYRARLAEGPRLYARVGDGHSQVDNTSAAYAAEALREFGAKLDRGPSEPFYLVGVQRGLWIAYREALRLADALGLAPPGYRPSLTGIDRRPGPPDPS